jgi:hypothetical protein
MTSIRPSDASKAIRFDPVSWRPRVATAAFLRARADDTFWAARRVAAFTDEMIRAAVKSGGYSDPAAEELLTSVLIKRRDKIAAAYLPSINPLVDFALARDGQLTFRNAAVDAGRGSGTANGYPRFLGDIRQRHGRDAGESERTRPRRRTPSHHQDRCR